MKKRVIFLVLSLLVLTFFACEFTVPTAILIKGTPTVRFAENYNIGKMFADLLDDAIKDAGDEKMSIFSCRNSPDLTYLIHMDLFSEEFDIGSTDDPRLPGFPGMDLSISDIDSDVPLSSEKTLIDGLDERMILPLSDVGSLLNDFEFSEYKIKLYFSGTPIVDKARIDIKIEEVENDTYQELGVLENINIQNGNSDIENWKANNGYSGASCPSGGLEIEIPISKKDIAVSFKVFIPAGQTVRISDFQDGSIKVEVVIWFPFVFKAGVNGAEIAFPDDALFDSQNDLFGRDSPNAESMIADNIESLSLEIVFDNNPFKGSDLIVTSKGIEITKHLTDNSFLFDISEEDMRKINSPENWPFTPNFKMRFSSGHILRFPQEFNATEFIFKAKIKYRMDL